MSMSHFRIIERNGKYGLMFADVTVLHPMYTSLEMTNEDSAEYTLDAYADDPVVISVGEYNFPIIIADGKWGLVNGPDLVLSPKYERIIKLTWCHYLCKGDSGWELYLIWYDPPELLATIPVEDGLTLERVLQVLQETNAKAFIRLSKILVKSAQGTGYISEYHLYQGTEQILTSLFHDFHIAVTKVIIDNDFHVTPLNGG